MERYNEGLPPENWDVYQAVDHAPWGAEEVFQRYSSGTPSRQYLLCWPGRMAEIRLYWDEAPTPEQMAVIGETLQTP